VQHQSTGLKHLPQGCCRDYREVVRLQKICSLEKERRIFELFAANGHHAANTAIIATHPKIVTRYYPVIGMFVLVVLTVVSVDAFLITR